MIKGGMFTGSKGQDVNPLERMQEFVDKVVWPPSAGRVSRKVCICTYFTLHTALTKYALPLQRLPREVDEKRMNGETS